MDDIEEITEGVPVEGQGLTASAFTPTMGMQQVQNAVEFTNEQVLQPDVKPMMGTSKLMADQAAAMMIQDVRSYLQGNEQILTIATAKALALIMSGNPKDQEAGALAMTAITGLQTSLPVFVGAVSTVATTIAAEFGT